MAESTRDITKIVSDTLNLIDAKKHFTIMSQIRLTDLGTDKEQGVKSIYITDDSNAEFINDNIWIASYRSPLGRIAEFAIGETSSFTAPTLVTTTEKECKILQKNRFKWIATDDVSADMFFQDKTPVVLSSFRKYQTNASTLLAPVDTPIVSNKSFDLNLDFDAVISADQTRKLFSKTQKKTIKKLGLTGEDVLDHIQGSIMRETPYTSRILMGPAGTGKTTTMIKKLGMNMDKSYTQLRDKDTLGEWYMFTPNHLLKKYLKEAFAKEGIGAPDEKVMVWNDFARQMGIDLKLLKSLKSEGFELDDKTDLLKDNSADALINLYEKFTDWYFSYFNTHKKELYQTGLDFHESDLDACLKEFEPVFTHNMSILVMCQEMDELLQKYKDLHADILRNEETTPLIERMEYVKNARNRKIFAIIQDIINNRNKTVNKDTLLFDIQRIVDTQMGRGTPLSIDKNEIFRTLIVPAVKKFASGGKMTKQDVLVLQKLGFGAKDEKLPEIVKIASLNTQLKYCEDFIRFCTNLRAEYINAVHGAYKEFRKAQRTLFTDPDSQKISQNELDILLLFLVQTYNILKYSTSKFPQDYYRVHIYIDEITDFSPIQIKIIYNLFHKEVRPALFATGDFNQRFTIYGIRNQSQLNWAIPDAHIQELIRPYRQTQILANLSQKLKGESELSIPQEFSFKGEPPVVGYEKKTTLQIAEWLKDRLLEIASKYDELPSIAIIVESEHVIEPLANEMNKQFQKYNIEVEPCYNGRVLGEKNNIRIFSVDYIKGLEFESVFFVNIDKLAAIKGDTFKNFLYVGASRAAMFFGITTTQSVLPPELSSIVSLFTTDWK